MTTTNNSAKYEKSYDTANLYVECKEINGRVYWYGKRTLDGLAIKKRADTFGRISKAEAVRILAQFGFTTDEFVAEYKRQRKAIAERDMAERLAIYAEENARKADEAAIEYAVTEEAQDVATNSEIRNANIASGNYDEYIYCGNDHGFKLFEFVTFKNHSIVRIENPRYGLTLNTTFRGNRVFKHNGRRIAAKAVAEVYMNRERADEQDKIFSAIFTPHHFGLHNRQRVMFTVNVHTNFADGTAHNFYGEFENYSEVEPFVQEVKTLADELNIPVEVSTEARYNKYPQATVWVDPHQYGEPGNLEQPRDISVYCNKPAAESTTPVTVNDDEDKIVTFEVGKTYYGDDFDGEWTIDGKVIIHTLTVISRTAKTLTAVDEAGNTVTKKIVLGYSGTLESVNVLGVNDITVQTVKISANHEYTPAIAAVSTEHYLDWMNAVENIELGLPTVDEPATPTVDELEAEIADNLRAIDKAYTELEAIEAEVGDEDCLTPQEHIDYLNDFIAERRERVNECRNQIDSIKSEGEYAQVAAEAEDLFYQLQDVKPAARFELPYCIKFPNGEELWSLDGKWNHVASDKYGADIYRNGIDDSREFVIRYSDDDKRWATAEEFFAEMIKRGACTIDDTEPPTAPLTAAQAEYDAAHADSIAATQAVIDADNALRHAKELERQAAERESAAFFKLGNLKREITDTVDQLNAAAPEGWSVVPDPDNKKFFVKTGGKSVAEIDSLALAKVLPPDKFFARFTPLTDDEPNQRYADQLYQEYLELLDMRDNLSDDPERLKVIDGLIRDLEREMLAARLDLPTSTPTSAC